MKTSIFTTWLLIGVDSFNRTFTLQFTYAHGGQIILSRCNLPLGIRRVSVLIRACRLGPTLDRAKDQDNVVLATGESETLKNAYEMLRLEGCKVLACTNLKAARCLLVAASPRIVVVDYHLPDGDVGEFFRAAKSANPHMKCIVLAEAAQLGMVSHAMREFAARVVAKPLEPMIFSSVVRACRRGPRSGRKRSRSIGPRGQGGPGPV